MMYLIHYKIMKYHQGVETLLHNLHVSPLKRYGQNFLVDESVINTIIEHANIQENDVVMEIGPGLGALTQKLNFEKIKYISYEIDRTFHQYLSKQYPIHTQHNLGNFLKATAEKCDVILGNLPYYVTTEILEKIMKDFSSARRAIVMLQKEVVMRILAQPDTPFYGPLAMILALIADIKIVQDVGKEAFYPEPHVTSSILQFDFHKRYQGIDRRQFFYFVKKLFLHRRKNLINNLMNVIKDRKEAMTILAELDLALTTRPEQLPLDKVIALFERTLAKN